MIVIIYENVKALADEKGLSITALEKEAGVANGLIGKWRENTPQVDTLSKVAAVLGVTVDRLIYGAKK